MRGTPCPSGFNLPIGNKGNEMSWTKPYDENILLQNDTAMCVALSLEALVQAHLKGIEYDLDPATYVANFFGGIQPSVGEFLNFLTAKGLDAEAIYKAVTERVQMIRPDQIQNQEKAATFFRLFQTEWHVLQEHIEKYIDEDSIYFLLELAVADAASTKARLNAIKMHAANPKQRDKGLVRECWDDWQKLPERYAGKAEVARDMLAKFETLKSQPVIEGWCRAWERKT